jgi:hypothetical protein
VDSALDLRFLRPSEGPTLRIEQGPVEPEDDSDRPLLEWRRREGYFARIYESRNGFRMWLEDLGWFDIQPEGARIVVPESRNEVLRETRLWGIPMALCALHRGHIPLHSAAVEILGRAVLFLAPSHHGKTTLAAALFGAGHRLLSEDLTYCRLGPEPAAFPGPALVRVRKDMFEVLDLKGARVVGTDDQRMYLEIDSSLRGDGSAVSLAAVVLLRPSTEGIRIEEVAFPDALRDLWPMAFNLPTDEDRRRCFDAIGELAASVPVLSLYRPVRLEALEATMGAIVEWCMR